MKELYGNIQYDICEILDNALNDNKLSHAYLFVENNYKDAFDFVMSFAKEIIGFNLSNEERDVLFKRIDDNNYLELKIIEADGMYIKKQQMIDLKSDHSKKSLEGSKRIYIINDVDKMRTEAANSILKFLEEPNSSIVALLLTNNINNVLSTIISRCQIIRFKNIEKNNEVFDKMVVEFVSFILDNKINSFISIREKFKDFDFKNKSDFMLLVDNMIELFNVILKYKIEKNSIDDEQILYIMNKLELSDVFYYIDYLIDIKKSIKLNVNYNLILDNIIMMLGGFKDGSRC